MNKKVEESRVFKRSGALSYLSDEDRHLTASDPTEYSFGFIGTGMMGQEHIHNTLLVGRAHIGGIFDPSDKSAKHALEIIERSGKQAPPQLYRSVQQACDDPATDALIIATPNHTHLDVVRTAVQSGKAIFLEKPIATSVADAYELCQMAQGHAQPFRFGLQYRYKSIYAEALKEVFERGSLGQVHSVNMLEHRFPFLDKVGQWNKFSANTGGTLVEKCCHYFDLMNLFADSLPTRVFAVGNQAVNFKSFSHDNKKADGLDQAQVTIQYSNGVIGGFSLCMFAPGTREELIVCGGAGRLQASESAVLGGDNKNRLEIWRGENGASDVRSPTYPGYIERAGHHGSTFFEHLSFIEQLSGDAHTGPTLADGFWSVVVGAAAQLSIERGEAVDVAELLPQNFSAEQFGASTNNIGKNLG
ncbi:MAG: Gfo/Idh/MocA family oxidoreductase [Pseudomonadota bacterium]